MTDHSTPRSSAARSPAPRSLLHRTYGIVALVMAVAQFATLPGFLRARR